MSLDGQVRPEASAVSSAEASQPVSLLEKIVGGIAGCILFALMLCTFLDVAGRFFFNRPLPGALEFTEIMMGGLIFSILPLVTARREHITVDILDLSWSGLDAVQSFVINVASAVMLALLGWRLWLQALDMAAYDAMSPFLGLPMAPVAGFMSIMIGVTVVVLLILAFRPAKRPSISDPPKV